VNSKQENNFETYVNDLDLPLFDLPSITAATNNFSDMNQIGEGGFGPVYWVIQCFYLANFNIRRLLESC